MHKIQKMMSKFLALFFLLFSLIACEDKPKNSFNLEEVKGYIERQNKTYGERYLVNEANYTLQKYTKDACILTDKGPRICGIPGIAFYFYNEGKNVNLKIDIEAKTIFGGPEYVVEEGIFELKDDKENKLDDGKYIAIWKQENKMWKIYREIWNYNIESSPSNSTIIELPTK